MYLWKYLKNGKGQSAKNGSFFLRKLVLVILTCDRDWKIQYFSSYKPVKTHSFQISTTLRLSGPNFIEIQQPNQFLWLFIFDGSDLTRHVPKGLNKPLFWTHFTLFFAYSRRRLPMIQDGVDIIGKVYFRHLVSYALYAVHVPWFPW